MVDKTVNVNIDIEETANYKWINIDELSKGTNYGKIIQKIEKILHNYKK